jgi:hypothetical protein
MSNNFAKAAVGALALNGGGGGGGDPAVSSSSANTQVPECPAAKLPKYHDPDNCLLRPSTPHDESSERALIYASLRQSATGATLVPNQQTVVCPLHVQPLEITGGVKGFDTTWVVENSASVPIVLSWVVDGQEWSPFHPDLRPQDDPEAILQPGDWTAVPTFESFVYHAREVTPEGPGMVLLQHRAGLIPLGNPNDVCDATLPDVEPIRPHANTAERAPGFRRTSTHSNRKCNTLDIGFRNQVGCPLHVYWANNLGGGVDGSDVPQIPTQGFTCSEKFKFHLGTKPATQDYMHDWESSTKFEGSFIGHTFVARLASDPNVVVDSYTLLPTQVVDCPDRKQTVAAAATRERQAVEVAEVQAQGDIAQLQDPEANAAAMAAVAAAGATTVVIPGVASMSSI